MQGDDEEETEAVPTSLTSEVAAGGLSGLKDVGHLTFNYTKLELTGKSLVDLQDLSKYTALLLVDVSDNQISDASQLSKLPALMSAKLNSNKIASLDLNAMECLQLLSLKNNEITALPPLNTPTLLYLTIDTNQISTLEGAIVACAKLRTLEARENKLTSTAGIEALQELEEAYFSTNEITELKLGVLPQLRTLAANGNQISSLASFKDNVSNLEHLDLNTNQITSAKELAHLDRLKSLKTLNLTENPVTGVDGYRKHVHAVLPQLETLDGEPWGEEDLEEPPLIAEEEPPAE